MRTVKVTIEFNTTNDSNLVTLTIPQNARVRFTTDARGRKFFAYEIGGHLYRPQLSDIRKFQALYDCKSYSCLSLYLKGETLTLIRTSY